MVGLNEIKQAFYLLGKNGIKQTAKASLLYLWKTSLRSYHSATNKNKKGDNVYEKPWDILIVLDACRLDLLEEVQQDYSWMEDIGSIWSVGSSSEEWMENTFTEEHEKDIKNTIYITGNAYSELFTDINFADMVEVWKYSWDDEYGVIRPRPITDALLNHYNDKNRFIVHYMQPHQPFLTKNNVGRKLDRETWGKHTTEKTAWEKLRDGEVSHEEVWSQYKENLRQVLEDVEIIVKNTDANIVITADHGNGLGEKGIYDHPTGIVTKELRQVPWVNVNGQGLDDYTPKSREEHTSTSTKNREEKLQDLGYL